ncbi:muscarinic acetylcholine receptor M5-like [Acanthaster planci]|uniref:Muscarinic acetylcholine receptor M5-like n=1 Tax=Acanthaster planci TaxID=133434 RepID=A0A8B7ZSL9_ACAPL|nr:muscarinic acetylcholine receptor M5-like [Acanthaster planci]
MQRGDDFPFGFNFTADGWIINSTTGPTKVGPPLHTPGFYIRAIVGTFVLLVTLLGNLLVLYVFATTPKLRTYTNYYLVGLAVADLVSGGITPILENVSWFLEAWPFGETACTINVYFNHLFLHATFLMTLMICVDRYRALKRPLVHLREKTLKHALLMMSFSYVVPFFIWTPLIIILPYSGVTRRVLPPDCFGSYGYHFPLLVFAIAVLSWIPMLTTTILYIFVFQAVIRGRQKDNREARAVHQLSVICATERPLGVVSRLGSGGVRENEARSEKDLDDSHGSCGTSRQRRTSTEASRVSSSDVNGIVNGGYPPDERENETRIQGGVQTPETGVSYANHDTPSSHQNSVFSSRYRRHLANLRATRTLTCILVVMVVSALPWSVFAFTAGVNPDNALDIREFRTMSWLVHLSSAANPFCYAVCNRLFKQAFIRVLCCGLRSH